VTITSDQSPAKRDRGQRDVRANVTSCSHRLFARTEFVDAARRLASIGLRAAYGDRYE
jgi:hypothetical protein